MAEVLKVFHFAKQHCVTEMQIGRSGIEASFNSQGTASFFRLNQPLAEILFANYFGKPLLQVDKLFANGHYFIKARRPIRA